MKKTIFIIITRSFITRNILRCGVLDLLKKRGYRVFVFFPRKHIPEYLKQEFENDQVKLVAIPETVSSRVHKIFLRINFCYLLFSKSTKYRALYFNDNARTRFFSKKFLKHTKVVPWLRYIYLRVASNSRILKFLFRFFERRLFPQLDPAIKSYFDAHTPDIVFSTSFVSGFDGAFMKEAKIRNIPTVSMPKSWDNIALGYSRFLPDYFIVPNEPSRHVAVHLQDIPADRVHIVGIPQFDWYTRKDIIKSREEHFKKKGLDPALPLIFFGSEGVWAAYDHEVAEGIYEWIKNNQLAKPCQLLARPHFTNADQDIFKKLRGKEKVIIDSYRVTNFLGDKWDPSKEEMIDFINTLYHCDIMINAASTLTLDAVCFDKPIINIGFGCLYEGLDKRFGRDNTYTLYDCDHFGWVLETGATKKVDTPNQLKAQINSYLLNPQLDAQAREVLRKKLCFKLDGRASERIVNILTHNQYLNI